MPNFDYEGAKAAGYTEEEINNFLGRPNYQKSSKDDSFLTKVFKGASNFGKFVSYGLGNSYEQPSEIQKINQKLLKKVPNFDFESAIQEGYSADEINEFLEENQPKKSFFEKGARLASQYALGAAEIAALPYEIAVAPLAYEDAMHMLYREGVMEDIERLQEQKDQGYISQSDSELLDDLIEQIKDHSKSRQYVKTADLSIRNLAEKATGIDFEPEGIAEKAVHFVAMIKDPKKFPNLIKSGIKPKELTKAIMPTGSEALRSLGAASGLQMAEEGNFGPIGTMAALVFGDLMGAGIKGGLDLGKKIVTKPKQTLANVASKFTNKEKLNLQKEIIQDFRNAGIQADLGTITDNNLIKWTQARLAQSGLAGKALDEFKENLTNQIKNEYKALSEGLGEAKALSSYEAGEMAKQGIKKIRDSDLAEVRKIYSTSTNSLKQNAQVDSKRLANAIQNLEKDLKPGQIKSAEQLAVLDNLDKLKRDIYDSEGNLLYAKVKDLINNKVALNDIINYEVQGGTKQLLKNVVSELDRAIVSHGKENPTFAKNYVLANKRFSEHAKTFRNKQIDQLLKDNDPAQLMNKMNSVHGIRRLKTVLNKTPEGKEIFDNLRRIKFEKVFENSLGDNAANQIKMGTFSNVLTKGNNKEVVKEILGINAFKRLEKLQKNAYRLSDSAQKFYNASKSGVVAADAAVLAKGMNDIAHILAGNPWPLVKTAIGVTTTRQLSKLLADPEFLKLVEDVILNSEKGVTKEFIQSVEKLRPYIVPILEKNQSSQQD